jgi:ABC-type branched-subunit amino acid transport system substrate-binding protein
LGLQVSHSATSPQLKGRNYPMFGRTVLSDTLLTEAVISLFDRFGWTNVGVLHDDADKWSNDFAQAIVNTASNFGVRCVCYK